MTGHVNLREIVLDILSEVFENGQYSHVVINNALSKYLYLEKQERAFISRLAQGTLENKIYLEYVINGFSKTPTAKMKPLIRNIMLLSVYQLLFMEHVPDSAVCNEAVKLTQKRGLGGLKSFVNGVLRNIARNKNTKPLPAEPVKRLSVEYSMPEWLVLMWLSEYDEQSVEKMLNAFLQEKRTYIRCRQDSVEAVRQGLLRAGMEVKSAPYLNYAMAISGYNYLGAIPEFVQGLFQVQDLSSMLVGLVAAPKAGDYVIDVCAAPGGKATHVAELLNGTGHVEARDISEYKAQKIQENVRRLGLDNVEVCVSDAACHDEKSEDLADILLCDLPCSGLGVIGRKPDIKYRMSPKQLEQLAELQRTILENVWNYVKVGGRLVFSTCTINKRENEENVKWLMEQLPFEPEDIRDRLPKELADTVKEKNAICLLPGHWATDGFFIASFIRKQ